MLLLFSVQEEYGSTVVQHSVFVIEVRCMLLVSLKHGGNCIFGDRQHAIEDRDVAAASADLLHESKQKS